MTHSIEVKLTIHTNATPLDAEAYRSAVSAAVSLLQNRKAIKPGMVMGTIDKSGGHVMAEMEVPMLLSPVDGALRSALVSCAHDRIDAGLIATMSGEPLPGTTPTMLPHQQRVVEEHAELAERLQKLGKFITDTPTVFLQLPLEEQDLLHQQHAAMTAYHDILVQRIAGFAGA